MPDTPRLHLRSRVARADGFLCRDTGAVVPPIHPSTTFARNETTYEQVGGRGYTRDENPTYEIAECLITDLEGGAASCLFGSGMAAIATLVQALRPGDHIVAGKSMYFGTPKLLKEWAVPWGLGVDLVDITDTNAIAAALKPGQTKLVLVETPANPLWAITDIAAAAELAHGAGALLAVDNTAATPVLTRPIELGADIVVHSATKYLNGHSDVLAGALVTARADHPYWERVIQLRYLAGPVLGPFEAWLLLRGMRTLFVRVERQCASALSIARHFAEHAKVVDVCYPGLQSFPGHEVARRQMTGGFGGMLSLRVAGGAEGALALIKRCRVWQRATSLGGVESLIEHRHTIEGPDTPTPPDLLRLSVGIEAVEDLVEDIEQALAA